MIELNENFLKAARNGDTDSILRLLNEGANIETRDEEGRTALHLTAEANHLRAAQILLECKANVDAMMIDEGTPLFDAVANGHDGMVSLLLNAGADPHRTDDQNWTPLHWAVVENHLSTARLLLERFPFLVNKTKDNGPSPLYFAANSDNLELVKLLVRHGAQITKLDDYKKTPIDIARENGHQEVAEYLEGKLIHRQERTQARFFDYKRSRKEQTRVLVGHYTYFRQSPDNPDKIPLEANGIPSRRLVMGDAGALKESMRGLDETLRIPPEEMARNGGWHNGGLAGGGRANANWSREYIHYLLDVDQGTRGKEKKQEELTVSSQYKPVLGHRGNFRMDGIGDYGTCKKKDILFFINEATRVEPDNLMEQAVNEAKLARLILEYARNGTAITTGILQTHGFSAPLTKKERVQQLHYLNRLCYLATVKEVSRRMYPGPDKNGRTVEELPMGVAYVMALYLIANGHLRMQHVFEKNAPYGLPTADNISSAPVTALARTKLAALNDLFYKTYPTASSSREGIHQLLLGVYGGVSDTSGNEYDTSEEENPVTPFLGGRN